MVQYLIFSTIQIHHSELGQLHAGIYIAMFLIFKHHFNPYIELKLFTSF